MKLTSIIKRAFSRPPAKPLKQLTYVEKIEQRVKDLEILSECEEKLQALEEKYGLLPDRDK